MKNISKIQRGFTLVELILYVALISLITLSSAAVFIVLAEVRVKHGAIAQVEQQGTAALSNITQLVRNAVVINSPTGGATAPSLSIDTISAANNPTVFDVSGGVLRIKEGAASPIALTNSKVSMSVLSFTNLSKTSTPGTIRIQFTLSHVNPTGRYEYNFSKTFYGSSSIR